MRYQSTDARQNEIYLLNRYSKQQRTTELLTVLLPYVQGVSEPFRRCLEQQGIRTVFKSETTLKSHLVRLKDTVDPAKQDGVVYRIPCECGKVYVGETGRSMHERIKEHDRD